MAQCFTFTDYGYSINWAELRSSASFDGFRKAARRLLVLIPISFLQLMPRRG